jgi:hypothetical protein
MAVKFCRAIDCKYCILVHSINYSVLAGWPSSELFCTYGGSNIAQYSVMMLAGCYASSCFCTTSRGSTPSPLAPVPPGAALWASQRRPTACSTSSGAVPLAVLSGAVWGSLGCMGRAALDAVMRRVRAALLLLLLSCGGGEGEAGGDVHAWVYVCDAPVGHAHKHTRTHAHARTRVRARIHTHKEGERDVQTGRQTRRIIDCESCYAIASPFPRNHQDISYSNSMCLCIVCYVYLCSIPTMR